MESDSRSARWFFVAWLLSLDADSTPRVDHRLPDPSVVHELVDALATDPSPLPPQAVSRLGPASPSSYADAVRLLRWLRHAERGPQCRSYRASVYFLQQLHPANVDVLSRGSALSGRAEG